MTIYEWVTRSEREKLRPIWTPSNGENFKPSKNSHRHSPSIYEIWRHVYDNSRHFFDFPTTCGEFLTRCMSLPNSWQCDRGSWINVLYSRSYFSLFLVIFVLLKYNWARPWENMSYAICEQQRRRSACASAQSDQRLCCSPPRQNDTSSLYIRNFKILAGLCSWAGQFVSCLVGDSRRLIFS